MARRYSYSSKAVTIAATTAQTLVWTAADIPSAGAVAYIVNFTVANNDIGALTRVKVKADGTPIIDAPIGHFRAFVQALSKSNEQSLVGGFSFIIPLNIPDAPTRDAQDACQFPPGQQVSVELTTDNSTAAGNAYLGVIQTNVPAQFYSTYICQAMGILDNQTQQRFNLPGSRGEFRGFSLNTVGLEIARLVLNGDEWFNLPGPSWANATAGDMIASAYAMENPGPGGTPVADPLFMPLLTGESVVPGASYLELSTNGADTWAGATNELGIHTVIPLG